MFLFCILDTETFVEKLSDHVLKVYYRNIGKYLFLSSGRKENYAQENLKINKNHHIRYFISNSTFKAHVLVTCSFQKGRTQEYYINPWVIVVYLYFSKQDIQADVQTHSWPSPHESTMPGPRAGSGGREGDEDEMGKI